MSKGILHRISKAADLGTLGQRQITSLSDEQPTLADLVLPGTGRSFSDEFACFLKMLGGERAPA